MDDEYCRNKFTREMNENGVGHILLKNNANLANLRLMSIVGMN